MCRVRRRARLVLIMEVLSSEWQNVIEHTSQLILVGEVLAVVYSSVGVLENPSLSVHCGRPVILMNYVKYTERVRFKLLIQLNVTVYFV